MRSTLSLSSREVRSSPVLGYFVVEQRLEHHCEFGAFAVMLTGDGVDENSGPRQCEVMRVGYVDCYCSTVLNNIIYSNQN